MEYFKVNNSKKQGPSRTLNTKGTHGLMLSKANKSVHFNNTRVLKT